MTLWGIEEFETAEQDEGMIVFEPSDFYYRRATPDTANSWHLAIYAFGIGAVPPLRVEAEHAVLDYVLNPLSAGVPGSVVKMKTIYLRAEQVYLLGLYVERVVGQFLVPSGWTLNGPGNYTAYQSGYVLQAIYPREMIPVQGRGSLDRTPPASGPGEPAP